MAFLIIVWTIGICTPMLWLHFKLREERLEGE